MNKEQTYDRDISPLMVQIVEICKLHGIAMIASFAIPTEDEEDLVCTTYMPDGTGESVPAFERALRCIRAPEPLHMRIDSPGGNVAFVSVAG